MIFNAIDELVEDLLFLVEVCFLWTPQISILRGNWRIKWLCFECATFGWLCKTSPDCENASGSSFVHVWMKTSVTHEFVVVVCSSQRFLQVPCGFILGTGELTHLIIIGREIHDRLARFQNVTDFHHNYIWFNGAAQLMKKHTHPCFCDGFHLSAQNLWDGGAMRPQRSCWHN